MIIYYLYNVRIDTFMLKSRAKFTIQLFHDKNEITSDIFMTYRRES